LNDTVKETVEYKLLDRYISTLVIA
jgi:hypothetical protein